MGQEQHLHIAGGSDFKNGSGATSAKAGGSDFTNGSGVTSAMCWWVEFYIWVRSNICTVFQQGGSDFINGSAPAAAPVYIRANSVKMTGY